MEMIQPWNTTIGKVSFTPEVMDVERLLGEVMAHPRLMNDVKVGSVRLNHEEFPICSHAIDTLLRDEVKKYVIEIGGRSPHYLKWSAWVHLCIHGNGLVPHYHMGDEHISTLLYLTESKANLVLRDTRAPLVRHFPQDMLAKAYADYHVHPRKGDFCVFPSYIDHYVIAAEPDFRVSLAIDWCFK